MMLHRCALLCLGCTVVIAYSGGYLSATRLLPVGPMSIHSIVVPRLKGAFEIDVDYVCCELFNSTNPPPPDWEDHFPGGVTDRPDTAPAFNVTACVEICSSLYYQGCKAAAVCNKPLKQCFLKTGKANPQPVIGDISFQIEV